MLPRLVKNYLREQLGSVFELLLAVDKKALPDWGKTGRAYFQIYFLDFFI
jgi:hypothetical protein